jgi:hypothetical protein
MLQIKVRDELAATREGLTAIRKEKSRASVPERRGV